MTKTMISLREIQKMDERLRALEQETEGLDLRLEEVEEPALRLEAELEKARERLAQMEKDSRRLERSADDKRTRVAKLQERLKQVQNIREEAAVHTELDLLHRAVEADEHEALQLMDRIQRAELARDELETETAEARVAVEPDQAELTEKKKALDREIEELRTRREAALASVTGQERKVYESFHASGRSVVISLLLEDGACGNCFGVVPLQIQNEIRHTDQLIRCEVCGVILSAGDEEGVGEDQAGKE